MHATVTPPISGKPPSEFMVRKRVVDRMLEDEELKEMLACDPKRKLPVLANAYSVHKLDQRYQTVTPLDNEVNLRNISTEIRALAPNFAKGIMDRIDDHIRKAASPSHLSHAGDRNPATPRHR